VVLLHLGLRLPGNRHREPIAVGVKGEGALPGPGQNGTLRPEPWLMNESLSEGGRSGGR
jgi:hypothetical protein